MSEPLRIASRPTAVPAGWRRLPTGPPTGRPSAASWGKAMMWIFLLSDTFVFSCFLISYMTVRMSTTVPWPNPSEVFALTIGGKYAPAHPDRHHDLRPDLAAAARWRWR